MSPLLFFAIPLMMTKTDYIKSNSTLTIVLLVFFTVSCLMLVIMLFDLLFGFSTRYYIKGTKEFKKIKNYQILEDAFEEIKMRFNKPNVKLMISNSGETNAFAIGNLGKQYIVITKGLITEYLIQLKDREYFINCIKCIIGHEMSHLINKDYLPGLLLKVNEMATNFVSKIIISFFNVIIRILSLIPFVGAVASFMLLNFYKILDFIITFFYKYIILSIYKFIQLKISRDREYRCDKQSAMVSGGNLMAEALSVFGEQGYFTIFSTHPRTSSRVKKVKKIKEDYGIIMPEFGNNLVNFISVFFIIILPLIIYYYMDIKGLVESYNSLIFSIRMKIDMLKLKIMSWGGILENFKFKK
ncbi:MAG TPA: M48 family metalloprotease [Rickettsiales bacterium]|nr:M48 family metalloprotease [Rickettsiales bacterium]